MNLSSEQFLAALQSDPLAFLLDVRTAAEFNEQHLPNAVLIDIKQASFVEDIAELDPLLNYYVYCRIGIRSANACMLMRRMGLKTYNLRGGIEALE